jgi:hypothetical protein
MFNFFVLLLVVVALHLLLLFIIIIMMCCNFTTTNMMMMRVFVTSSLSRCPIQTKLKDLAQDQSFILVLHYFISKFLGG